MLARRSRGGPSNRWQSKTKGELARSFQAEEGLEEQDAGPGAEDEWHTALAALDAVLQRSTHRLDHIKARMPLPAIDNDQADALNRWQSVVFGEASTFPPTLAAAILHDAWLTLISPAWALGGESVQEPEKH